MNNLTSDRQKVTDELIDLVMQRIYTKIAPSLTDEDITKIESLDQEDNSGNAVRDFLLSKVPDFDKLFEEEINLLKSELGSAGK